MTKAAVAPPATLVIFGAQGDLTKRLLLPAIVNLARSESREGQPESYVPGSAGPADAEALLSRDGRAWHPIG